MKNSNIKDISVVMLLKIFIYFDDNPAYCDGVEIYTPITDDYYRVQVDFIQVHQLNKNHFCILYRIIILFPVLH